MLARHGTRPSPFVALLTFVALWVILGLADSPTTDGGEMEWKQVASGHYETPDGRYMMWRIPDVYPPAWNIENTETGEPVVDGAATMRDARAICEQRKAAV